MTRNGQKSAIKMARVLDLNQDTRQAKLSVKRFEDFAAQLVALEWTRGPRVPTTATVVSLETLNETPKLVPTEKE